MRARRGDWFDENGLGGLWYALHGSVAMYAWMTGWRWLAAIIWTGVVGVLVCDYMIAHADRRLAEMRKARGR